MNNDNIIRDRLPSFVINDIDGGNEESKLSLHEKLFPPQNNSTDLSRSWSGKETKVIQTNLSSSITHNGEGTQKKHHADLFTPIGWDATRQAFVTGAFLMTFLSQDEKEIKSGDKSHQEVHQGMVRASKETVKQLDPNNPKDQSQLRGIASQWVKGFSPKAGGMGRFPKIGVDLRKKLTQKLVDELSRNKQIEGLEVGKSLIECGVTDLDIINAYGNRKNIPAELQTSCNPTFDDCPGWGTKPFLPLPEVTLKDMSLKEVGLSEGQVALLFAPKMVPNEYRVGNSSKGAINMDIKLNDSLLEKLESRGIISKKDLEKARLIFESKLQRPVRMQNAQLKAALLDMLNYLDDNATSHFDPKRNSTALKTATTQVYATLGQFYHDHILEGNEGLKQAFYQQGLCNEESIQLIKDFDKSGRSNPLLAEVKNSEIVKTLSNTVIKDKSVRKKLEAEFFQRLSSINEQKKLGFSDDQLREFSKTLIENFGEELSDFQTHLELSNPRGRVKSQRGKEYRKDLAKILRGDDGKNASVITMPQGSDDKIAESVVMMNIPEVNAHFAQIDTQEGLFCGPPPKTELRQSGGLDSTLRDLYNNPLEIIRSDALQNKNDEQSLLAGFINKDVDTGSFEAIQDIIGSVKVPYNKATPGQTIPFKEFAEQESVTHIMNKYDVRTICGVSGTTLDCIVGALGCMSKDDVVKLLQPLLDHAKQLPDISQIKNEGPSAVKDEMIKSSQQGLDAYQGGEDTMHFLSCVGTLMQGGRYHTVGEVIGGLYVAARGLISSPEDNINIDQTRNEFEKLIADYSVNPEHYIPIQDSQPIDEDDDVEIVDEYDEIESLLTKDELISLIKNDLSADALSKISKNEKYRKIKEKNNYLKV